MLGFEKIASLTRRGRAPQTENGEARTEGPTEVGAVPAEHAPPPPPPEPRLDDLEDLRIALGDPEVLRFENGPVRGLADHSELAGEGFVFFAVSGHELDGAAFASKAIGRGATAVVAQRPLPVPVPCFVVPDVRRAASRAADVFFGQPSRRVPVIGVTGTNGKTTVADLLRICLEDDERAVGSLGTVEYRLGPEAAGKGETVSRTNEVVLRARNTTPGPIEVQSYLREMVDRGVRAAVLEVSSHALDQGRTEAVRFSAGVFTNLSQDHLDYHGSMEAYAEAKARLFGALGPGALAVLPADDRSARTMLEAVPEGVDVVTYALGSTLPDALPEHGVHLRGEVTHADLDGTRLSVRTPEGCVEVHLPLVGRHNVRNALAAMACVIGMGVGSLRAADALSRARPVSGRLERIDDGRLGFHVFVDYAHTPDALAQVLRSLAPLTTGKLRVMFGCGGERDIGKRPIMGKIAAEHADHVVLTHDNPRREDPDTILEQILAGVARDGGPDRRIEVCPDRARAIHHVLAHAAPGDTVVLAGKGHERGQSIGGHILPFDDKTEAEAWLCSH